MSRWLLSIVILSICATSYSQVYFINNTLRSIFIQVKDSSGASRAFRLEGMSNRDLTIQHDLKSVTIKYGEELKTSPSKKSIIGYGETIFKQSFEVGKENCQGYQYEITKNKKSNKFEVDYHCLQ